MQCSGESRLGTGGSRRAQMKKKKGSSERCLSCGLERSNVSHPMPLSLLITPEPTESRHWKTKGETKRNKTDLAACVGSFAKAPARGMG